MPESQMTDDDLVTAWQTVQRGVARTHQRILEHIDLGGQSPLWFSVLHLLLNSAEHRLPMTSLARELSITTGGFTKLADRMAREGLIDRRGSSGDRRVVYATLTADGLVTAKKCEAQYREGVREHVADALTPSLLAALIEGAAQLSGSGGFLPESPAAAAGPKSASAENLSEGQGGTRRRRAGD